MRTDYVVGNIRIRFESRARRRWFVALIYSVMLVYAVLAAFNLTQLSLNRQVTTTEWIVVGCGILFVVLWIVLPIGGWRARACGDER